MTEAECTVRPARPSREEGLVFARLANSAASNGFRYMFGPRVEEIIAAAFIEPNNDFSHEFVLFAEVGGRIVGMGSGYTAKQHGSCTEDAIKRAARRNALRVAIVGALVSPMFRFMHTYDEGDFYLQFLAVEEDCRGKGVGSALIEAMKVRGSESGSVQYVVDVAARNASAKRLYERQGFVTRSRWPRSRRLRATILRMTQDL